MKGDIVVNVDELIKEVLSLSKENKLILLDLLRSLLDAGAAED